MKETELFTYTNLIICAELMVNYQDELKNTPVYKQQIKNYSKNLQEELEKMLKVELPKLYSVDEQFLVNIMREYKDLVENLTSTGADDLIAISQIIKEYKKDKDTFLDKHQLTLKKIDE